MNSSLPRPRVKSGRAATGLVGGPVETASIDASTLFLGKAQAAHSAPGRGVRQLG